MTGASRTNGIATGRIGVLAIGQTPRVDLEKIFEKHSPGSEVLVLGALDGIAAGEISAMSPSGSQYPLHTRLADGSTVDVARDAIALRLPAVAATLVERGAGVLVLACTGPFEPFDCPVPLVIPDRVLPPLVRALTRRPRIGVVVPISAQMDVARAKWQAEGFSPKVVTASPFNEADSARAGDALRDPTLELVVLDCMGHSPTHRSQIALRSHRPVIAAQTLVARLAGEIAEGLPADVVGGSTRNVLEVIYGERRS